MGLKYKYEQDFSLLKHIFTNTATEKTFTLSANIMSEYDFRNELTFRCDLMNRRNIKIGSKHCLNSVYCPSATYSAAI